MTLAAAAVVGTSIVFCAFVSGVFGMAGGMILIGVLLVYLDVATAMVLFTIVLLGTNGWRTLHWRRHVSWPIFRGYAAGAVVAAAVMHHVAYVPDKAVVYLLLGAMPFAVEMLPRRLQPSIEWRGVPFLGGIVSTFLQFVAGVAGLFLDVFFQKSRLDRKATNATKAATQMLGSVLRGLYFGTLAGATAIPASLWIPAVVLALTGSMAAPLVVERMTDVDFRRWTRWIIFTVGGVFLLRGALLLSGRG